MNHDPAAADAAARLAVVLVAVVGGDAVHWRDFHLGQADRVANVPEPFDAGMIRIAQMFDSRVSVVDFEEPFGGNGGQIFGGDGEAEIWVIQVQQNLAAGALSLVLYGSKD